MLKETQMQTVRIDTEQMNELKRASIERRLVELIVEKACYLNSRNCGWEFEIRTLQMQIDALIEMQEKL